MSLRQKVHKTMSDAIDIQSLPPELGRFRLLSSLGQGAQATVWLAHDPRLDREVAVKVLRPGTDRQAVDEWLNEARAVSRLTHPNIVPVFEADTQGGQSYMVFEYVPGGTLAERMRAKRQLPAREAVELILGVLDGLQAAHQAGVVHRDLKPSNILIDAKGRARVMDFGIAARLSDAARQSQAQRIVGTPGYISPEAARGEAPGAPMDVFACAVMLAEMLSGQRMNQDPDPWRAVRRMIEQDLVLPSGLVKAISARLDKWRADAARDAKLMAEIKPLEQRYSRRLAELKGTADARLNDFRWQLEELRVSLFAQELRTPQPVSVKRLEKVWAQMST